MTYKQSITDAMTALAADPDVIFIGYGITRGKAMGTLANVKAEQLLETPIAENLMVGLATGMALRGRKPVIFIERCDFLLNALDAIVNHQAKMDVMSRGQFKPAVLYRIIIGNREKPLFTGETHVQDFSDVLWRMVNQEDREMRHHTSRFEVSTLTRDPANFGNIGWMFETAHERMAGGHSHAIFEHKDLY